MNSDFSILSDNDDLPIGWDKVELDKLLTQTENIIPADYEDELFELWSVPAFPSNEPEFLKGSEIGSNKQKVRQDDVLLCKINPRINRVWKVGKTTEFSQIASTEWIVFRSYGINPDFLVYKFQEPSFREELCENVSGVGGSLIRARPQEIKKLEIPIAPLNEQRRIVEKVEALMARSRRAKEALDAIPKLIEQFRQSVLAAAFRGDLTADWREQNPNIEPASDLLERIRKERREKWEHAELEKMRAKGKEPITDDWKQKYKEPELANNLELSDLPSGWCWMTLDEIMTKIVDGTHHTPSYIEQGIAFLSVKDIRDENISFDNCKYISPEEHQNLCERCCPEFGDLLITKSGTIGRCAIVKTDRPFSLFVSVALLKPASKEVITEYISLVFQAWLQTISIDNDVTGSTIKNFHIIDFKKLALPLAPLQEQKEIISNAKKILGSIKQTNDLILGLVEKNNNLNQSILSKAFKGELVEQDPTDEPASVLLERIQKEREKEKAKVKQTGAKKLKK